jgi:hypothetical protein
LIRAPNRQIQIDIAIALLPLASPT